MAECESPDIKRCNTCMCNEIVSSSRLAIRLFRLSSEEQRRVGSVRVYQTGEPIERAHVLNRCFTCNSGRRCHTFANQSRTALVQRGCPAMRWRANLDVAPTYVLAWKTIARHMRWVQQAVGFLKYSAFFYIRADFIEMRCSLKITPLERKNMFLK